MPNFLTAQFLKPDLIVPIASKQEIAEGKWEKLRPNLEPLCKEITVPKVVNAVDLAEIKSKCYEAINENPDVEWVFNVTCATTVMSIAAYEVAKEKNIDCWYLDTNTRQVSPLVGSPPQSDLYHISIEDYLKIYGRTISKRGQETISTELNKFIRKFADDVNFANKIQQSIQQSKSTGQPGQIVISSLDEEIKAIWQDANSLGLVSNLIENSNGKLFLNINRESSIFINGGWLESYLWTVIKNDKSFDDSGYSIVIPPIKGLSQYEIDFALTYAGMLLIIECKTGKSVFAGKHLDKLNSVANHLGSNFVGKIFITNQIPDETSDGVKGFLDQAKENHIVVITGKDLPNLLQILRKEAGVESINLNNPTFFRG